MSYKTNYAYIAVYPKVPTYMSEIKVYTGVWICSYLKPPVVKKLALLLFSGVSTVLPNRGHLAALPPGKGEAAL